MRVPLICFVLLICLLAMEAKSVSWKKDKTDVRDLEETLEDLKRTEMTFNGGKRKDNLKEALKALTEEESDPASGNGEIKPEEY